MPRHKQAPLDQSTAEAPPGLPNFTQPGLYGLILDYERDHGSRPDPRWRLDTEAGRRGESCPPGWGQSRISPLLQALQDGRRVQLPGWCALAGLDTFPKLKHWESTGLNDLRAELERHDRKIVGWFVYSNDLVAPIRNGH